jgi:hypothetical protein
MATLVLKILGDRISAEAKVVHSMKVAASFESEQARLKAKVGDLAGTIFYHCEGIKPHMRPTYPIPWKSTPGREKLKGGDFVWLREVTRYEQEKDVEFQRSLEAFRKERGYTGPQPENRDVDEFIHELSSKLASVKAEEIAADEAAGRTRTLASEFREFRDITIEYREVQQVKDDEAAGRQAIAAALQAALDDGYRVHVAGPRIATRLRAVAADEATDRSIASSEEGAARGPIENAGRAERRDLERNERQRRDDVESANRLVLLERERLLVAGRSESQSAGLTQEQLQTLLESAKHGGGGSASQDVLAALRALEQRVDEVAQAHKETARLLAAASPHGQRDEGLDASYAKRVQDQVGGSAEFALRAAFASLDASEVEKLLREQNELLLWWKMVETAADNALTDARHTTEASTVATVVSSMLAVQGRLQQRLHALEEDRAALHETMEELSATLITSPGSDSRSPLPSPSSPPKLKPATATIADPPHTGWHFDEGPPAATVDVLVRSVLAYDVATRQGYTTGVEGAQAFVADMFTIYSSPWEVADALESWCCPLSESSPEYRAALTRLRRCCDEHAPYLSSVAVLLLDLHQGRDAELCASIIRTATTRRP